MHLYPFNGAPPHRQNETAWSYRDAPWAPVMIEVDREPADNDEIISWRKELL